jgi:hypothetical protein
MDETEVYFVDTRNADARDHRTNVVRPGGPARAIVVPPTATSRVGWVQPATSYPNTVYGQPPPYAQPPVWQPPGYGQPPYGQSWMYGQPPVYGQPPFPGALGTLGALFGGINIGQVIDLVGQGFAALKALPAAPSSTGEVTTDVANLTLYQRALAEHGKLDEQIRTGVHIVAKLLGA